MSTVMTPPPAPPAPPVPPVDAARPTPPAPPTRGSSRVVAIIAIVLGAVVVLAAVTAAVLSTVAAASVSTSSRTLAVAGIDELDVDIAAGSLTIEFADVSEAELEVTAPFGAGPWTLERDDDSLVVASPDWHFGPWWLFGGANGQAVLRLPAALEGLDASLHLGAGDLTADGSFGELDLELGAGRAEVTGSANEVSADISAGRADLDLSDVRTAELTVSAGALDGVLRGSQPDELTLEVSAGSLDLTIPEGDYDVRSNVSAGDFDNGVGSVPDADSTVTVTVSAGQVVLNAG